MKLSEQIAMAMWAATAPSNPWDNALDEDYYDGPGRDSMRKMARAALEIVGQSAAIKAVDRFRLLFVADSDPAVLTAEVDPNEMANAYSELEAELSAFRRSVPPLQEE